jgi:putative spermidine/putrescine transport system permease protein
MRAIFKYLLLLPVLFYLMVFFVYPLLRMFLVSCFDPGFTLKHYVRLFDTPLYLIVIAITFKLALICTFFSLVFGYPVAYFLTSVKPATRNILIVFVVIPFWTSLLVRIYAWMVILGRHGVINTFLLKIGIISSPLDLIYNTFSVTVGMVHFLLPFMIFSIYSVMSNIDKDLIKAAYTLGANPVRAFIKVFFPLSLPGLGAGSLIVFILALGFFVTPALLGGPKDMVISMLIENQVSVQLNWPFAAAIGFALLIVTLIIFNAANKYFGISRIWGAKL